MWIEKGLQDATGCTHASAMKTYHVRLTPEEQKKLEQVLKRLRKRNATEFFVSAIGEYWLKVN